MVSLVSLVKMEVRVQLGGRVVLELPVQLVVRVPLVEEELLASKDHREQLGQLVRLVLLDSLEVLVQQVQLAWPVLLEQQEQLVEVEEQVHRALQE